MNVQERINQLLSERTELVNKYNELSQQLQSILTRLVQIQGALDELQKLSNNSTVPEQSNNNNNDNVPDTSV